MMNEPEQSYHGLVFTERYGAAAYIARCRSRLPEDDRRGAGADERLPAPPGH